MLFSTYQIKSFPTQMVFCVLIQFSVSAAAGCDNCFNYNILLFNRTKTHDTTIYNNSSKLSSIHLYDLPSFHENIKLDKRKFPYIFILNSLFFQKRH